MPSKADSTSGSSRTHTVLVLGAGASVSEALHFRPKQQREHPPLDANFFRRVEKNSSKALIRPVSRQAAAVGQNNLFRDDPPVSLEQHLGRLFFAMRNEGTTESRTAYFDLVRLYQSELLSTTNWMIGRRGMLRRLLQAELGAGAKITILTFNHDLLAENALDLLPQKFKSCWCMTHVYGLDGLEFISSKEEAFHTACPGCGDNLVSVLKLHGSMNWVFRTRDPYPPTDVGTSRGRKKRKLYLWTNKRLPGRAGIKLHTAKGRNWYLWPLIVPPVYEKHGMLRDELDEVWRRAAEKIAAADKAIFWGYSFPRADLHARYFFDRAANENEALREPILINPDPGSAVALWESLRPHSVRHYRDIASCIAEEY
jgi:hypothetical protein